MRSHGLVIHSDGLAIRSLDFNIQQLIRVSEDGCALRVVALDLLFDVYESLCFHDYIGTIS